MFDSPSFRWQALRVDSQNRLFGETRRVAGKGEYRGLEFIEVEARSIINTLPNGNPLPFRHTINAFRGCSNACGYCFARPTHEYLGFDRGADFDSKIVVKVNGPELLRTELARGCTGEGIAMGTNTDPYQAAEGKYRLTRRLVEVLVEHRNPFSVLTKSPLALRDLDLYREAARHDLVRVDFSVGTLDESVWRETEPGTPHPARRIEAVRKLNDAGVPSGVLMAPILPGLSDRPEQLDAVVEAAVAAGATFVAPILLHLRRGVRDHYLEWLRAIHPELLDRYTTLYPRAGYAHPEQRRALSRLIARLVASRGGELSLRSAAQDPTPIRVRPSQQALF